LHFVWWLQICFVDAGIHIYNNKANYLILNELAVTI